MSCQEYQTAFLVDPSHPDQKVSDHLKQCTACQRFAKDTLEMESDLKQVLRVDVPSELKDKILNKTQNQNKVWTTLSRGVAASLLLVAVLFSANLYYLKSFEKQVLAHLEAEFQALQANDSIQVAQLNKLLTSMGLHSQETIIPASFAKFCKVDQKRVAHLVYKISQNSKPITVMIIPGQKVWKETYFTYGDYQGYIIPWKNQNTLFIAAKKDQTIEGMRLHLLANLTL